MVSDELGKHLHDRSTCGEVLSAEEIAQLEDWYETQDRAEIDELRLTASPDRVSSLQRQVDAALAQLTMIARRIEEISEENQVLRDEIATLQRQFAQQAAPHLV